MRKRCRGRVRSRRKVVLTAYTRMVAYFAYSQDSKKWREWTFRTVSQHQAQRRVAAGEAIAITRWHQGAVRVVGYRALQPERCSRPTPSTLTYQTMVAVGNNEVDAELEPWERNQILKFKVWPLIGDTKAVAVRPRITDAERRLAEKLLGRGVRQTSGMLDAA